MHDPKPPPIERATAPLRAVSASVEVVQVGLEMLDVVRRMNEVVFAEERVINTFDRDELVILLAYVDDEPAGFKIGYRESRFVYYSAKGGVLPRFRRHGIARQLLHVMMDEARRLGYRRFAYDTFPNRHPGMTVLGLAEGFRVTKADYNSAYKDYRLRFEKKL